MTTTFEEEIALETVVDEIITRLKTYHHIGRTQLQRVSRTYHVIDVVRLIKLITVINISPKQYKLDNDQADDLKFVVAELTANAFWHAQANTVTVRVCQVDGLDQLEISIADNGQGMDAKVEACVLAIVTKETLSDQQRSYFGRGMGFWMCTNILDSFYNEMLHFSTKQGVGTTVSFTFPLNKPSTFLA